MGLREGKGEERKPMCELTDRDKAKLLDDPINL